MYDLPAASPRRALVVGAGATALLGAATSAACATLAATDLSARSGLDEMIAALAATVVLVAGPWCWLLAVVTCCDAVRGRTRRRVGCPAWVHRGVLAACGLALVTTAVPAQAEERPAPAGQLVTDASVGAATGGAVGTSPGREELLDGLPLPDRPATPAAPAAPDRPDAPEPQVVPTPSAASVATTVVVAAGDSLWSIAADLLPHADDATLVAAVATLHDANAAVVGPHPDLVLPGQRLDVRPLVDLSPVSDHDRP
ncbi:hypothetical protein RDV89_17615 [Nocardioides zeae]|uniref:LysM domain-containing protein n=1 Tax=Nocardioides imazamoxiresistens TaxID=3231893 RepID=A0ABU3Q081_9ACTN|nr:hypothetical protein [Nocardioides zeae]MDT9594911.1 hypothetical protein [Nocardioides zeae]